MPRNSINSELNVYIMDDEFIGNNLVSCEDPGINHLIHFTIPISSQDHDPNVWNHFEGEMEHATILENFNHLAIKGENLMGVRLQISWTLLFGVIYKKIADLLLR